MVCPNLFVAFQHIKNGVLQNVAVAARVTLAVSCHIESKLSKRSFLSLYIDILYNLSHLEPLFICAYSFFAIIQQIID